MVDKNLRNKKIIKRVIELKRVRNLNITNKKIIKIIIFKNSKRRKIKNSKRRNIKNKKKIKLIQMMITLMNN